MNDNTGGIVQLALAVGGTVCILNGFSVEEREYYGPGGYRYYDKVPYLNAAFYIGVVAGACSYACNIARSAMYKKNPPSCSAS